MIKYIFLTLLTTQVQNIKYITCPEVRTRSECSLYDNCIYYDWHKTGNVCYYDCQYYAQKQIQCVLLFNCKWQDSTCLQKECLDFTNQGFDTCLQTPGCRWHWNKCRQDSCNVLNAQDISECSQILCKWDENSRSCSDKVCEDYTNQSSCEGVFQCDWQDNKCQQEQFDQSLILISFTILYMFWF